MNRTVFAKTINHELTHCYDHVKYQDIVTESYRESKAYTYTYRYDYYRTEPPYTPYYKQYLSLYDWPSYLVPTNIPKLTPRR